MSEVRAIPPKTPNSWPTELILRSEPERTHNRLQRCVRAKSLLGSGGWVSHHPRHLTLVPQMPQMLDVTQECTTLCTSGHYLWVKNPRSQESQNPILETENQKAREPTKRPPKKLLNLNTNTYFETDASYDKSLLPNNGLHRNQPFAKPIFPTSSCSAGGTRRHTSFCAAFQAHHFTAQLLELHFKHIILRRNYWSCISSILYYAFDGTTFPADFKHIYWSYVILSHHCPINSSYRR